MTGYEYLLSDINTIKGVGDQTAKLLRRKNINTIFDLIWSLPKSNIDRTQITKIKDLQIGKIQTIVVNINKYNFPRIKNLPNKVMCSDETGKLECIFFNSYEGYIKKILPLGQIITISGKISYFRNKYQITNPTHISSDTNVIKKIHAKYSLTEGLNEKKYNIIINKVLENLPNLDEWLDKDVLKKFSNI